MKRVLGFSGGADSQACAKWLRERYAPEDIVLLNSNAGGNEHPLTVEFIAWYSANVFPVVVTEAIVADLGDVGTRDGATRERRQKFASTDKLTFDVLAFVKGRYPSRKAQFCTEYLKLAPQKRWMQEHLRGRGIDFVRYTGVRRDESQARSCSEEREWDGYFACEVVRPIVHWTKRQVFEYLGSEPINPLYRLGFNRVGCAPCVNSSKLDVRLWATRFPEMIDKVRAWEKSVGRTFFPPCVPGLEINWIDEVVAWSKTVRGGKQLELPMLEAEVAAGGCMSSYGLCE